jgi:hypothetical protein
MSNQFGNSATLSDPSGIVSDSSACQVSGVTIKTALTGSLTVTGVCNLDGTPASWVIPPASVGYVAPAGNSSGLAGRVGFSYSNAGADAGKAQLLFTPR